MSSRPGSEFNRLAVFVLSVSLCLWPAWIYMHAWHRDTGLMAMPMFGHIFYPQALHEVRDLGLPIEGKDGYDGQFYAQLSLDPTLRRPEFPVALDGPVYRSGRILMPMVAYVLGMGRASWTINCYVALNGIAWAALLILLLGYLSPLDMRKAMVIAAVMLTQGTLVSLLRALTDLPSTALLAFALLAETSIARSGWFSAAVLCRETSLVSALGMISGKERRDWTRLRTYVPIVVAAGFLALWTVYVHAMLPKEVQGLDKNFAFPLQGIAKKLIEAGREFAAARSRWNLFGLLAPISLAAQACFILMRWRPAEQIWRFAVAWALLFLVIGPAVWVDFNAFTRVLLPLTLGFNLLLHCYMAGWSAWMFWFVAGNAGLCMNAIEVWRHCGDLLK